MRRLILFLALIISCGPEPEPESVQEGFKLPEGYWVTFCRCQAASYPEGRTRPDDRCPGGHKITETCGYDDTWWCAAGEKWGERCL